MIKILHLDIETAPNRVYAWGLWSQDIGLNQIDEAGYTLCWAAKWLGKNQIFFDSLHRSSNEKMIKGVHALLEEADAVVHYNGCVVAGNRVLTKDFRWVDVATVKEGDELLAFQENSDGVNKARKYEVSKVVRAAPIYKECSELLLNDGTKITASNDHPWLTTLYKSSKSYEWIETKDLTNKQLIRMLPTWETAEDYAAGYLSAFFDGEGRLSQVKRKREHESKEYTFSLTFGQKDEYIITKLTECLDEHGFDYSVNSYDKTCPDIKSIRILGGFSECLRFLGTVRPDKLRRIDFSKVECMRLKARDPLDVVSVTPVGVKKVIGLETTSKTYFVEGIPCHNTKFDIPTLNKEFILLGMDPPAPYKEIDLLYVAKRRFRFPSNKLDYVAQALGLGSKVKHKGMSLWKGCMDGDDKAWKIMETYNKRDVRLLEKVYFKMLPWIKNHPNYGLYTDGSRPICKNCGSAKVIKKGLEYTSVGQYQRYKCSSCGTPLRGATLLNSVEERRNLLR